METRLLYQAKCKDLSIPNIENQYQKFRDNCLNHCQKRTFKMVGGQIGSTSAKVISLIIKANQNFSKFDIGYNKIGDIGITSIANVFENFRCPSIIALNVSTNSLSPVGLTTLFNSLHCNQSLIDLDISSKSRESKNRNRINTESIQALAELLKVNRFIQYINLSGLSIADKGLEILKDEAVDNSNHVSSLVNLNLNST